VASEKILVDGELVDIPDEWKPIEAAPDPDADQPLIGRPHIVHMWRKHGSCTFYLRWRTRVGGKILYPSQILGNTGPHPRKRLLQKWKRDAEAARYRKEKELLNPPEVMRWLGLSEAADHYAEQLDLCPAAIQARHRVVADFCAYTLQRTKEEHEQDPKKTWKSQMNQLRWWDAEVWAQRWMHRTTRRGSEPLPETLLSELAYLRQFFNWARESQYMTDWITLKKQLRRMAGELSHNPLAPIKNARIRGQIECARDLRQRTAFIILPCTGLRSGELFSLLDEHWDPAERALHVPKAARESTKRHKRDLHLGPKTSAVLEIWRASRGPASHLIPGLNSSRLGKWMHPNGLIPKQMRQWFLSSLERLDCPDRIIRQLMPHRSDKTRAAYSAYDPEEARPWMTKVEDLLLD